MGVSTETFVGSNTVIGFMVDMARIATYAAMFLLVKTTSSIAPDQGPLVLTGIVAAFVGVMIGKHLLHKIAMQTIHTLKGLLSIAVAFSLTAGFV